MSLTSNALQDLQAAVGKRHVSVDPGIIAGNAWNIGVGRSHKQPPLPLPGMTPLAVVLPGTTEEVAAVVKACNRHGLNFRAFSMGWGAFGAPTRPNTISIDLRRMNQCEVDAPNMAARIGPYVTASQLMAEAMKHGLTCHVVGAGPTHSPLASATSGWGVGVAGASTGHNARNLLSLEWVTPKGDIVRIGSAGSDLGWFVGDGPGPGFRGMIRGFLGTIGGLGVFTRIGFRLHPWHGPKQMPITGSHPQYGMAIGDNRVRFFHGVWPTWDGVQAAAFEFNASGVATVMLRVPPESIGWALTANNNEYYQKLLCADLPALARQDYGCSWSIVTTAYSDAQDAYKEKVVRHIIERTGGRLLEVAPEHAEIMTRSLVTCSIVPRVLRPTSYIGSSFGVFESFRNMTRAIEATKETYSQHDIAKKHFHTVGTEQNWAWPTERRHMWTEHAFAIEDDAAAQMYESVLHQEHLIETRRIGVSGFGLGPLVDFIGPRLGPNVNTYMRRIKTLFDPRNLSDPFFYISAKPDPAARLWPIVKRIAFRPMFRFIRRKMAETVVKKEY